MIAVYILLSMGFTMLSASTVIADTSEASSITTDSSAVTTLGPISTADLTNTTIVMSTTSSPLTTKPPAAPEGFWNTTCIRAEMAIGFAVEGSSEDSFYVFSDVYDDRSRCNISQIFQELILDHPQTTGIPEYSLALLFERNTTHTFVRNMTFNYMNNQTGKERFYNDKIYFKVKNGNSFFCPTTLNITFGNVTMHIYSLRLQAFLTADDNAFGPSESCPCLDCMSDLLAIAVACVLGSIIILVLISYLVGRRVSRQRGYLSV